MSDHHARSRHDEEVWRRHKQALASGERRVLSRTMTGELHGYAKEEIGFRRNGPGNGISTLRGLLVVTAGMTAFGILTAAMAAGAWSPEGNRLGGSWC